MADLRPDLVTVGGLTVDNVITSEGLVGLNKAGGNGAYSAVGALLWSSRIGLVSSTVESYPRSTISRLEENGIDLGGVVLAPDQLTACSWFIYDDQGRRKEGLTSPPEFLAESGFSTDKLSRDEITAWIKILSERDVGDEIGYSEFRTLHPLTGDQVPDSWRNVSGVHLAPSRPDVMLEILDLMACDDTIVTADPGWQLAELSLDELTPMLSRLDAFLPSEVELNALVPSAGAADALEVLADRCPGAIVAKMGPKGSIVWDRSKRAIVSVPVEPARTLDPTGAGDSFCGGFLAGLVETGEPVLAARFGAISAARTVSCFGADGPLPPDRSSARLAFNQEKIECH